MNQGKANLPVADISTQYRELMDAVDEAVVIIDAEDASVVEVNAKAHALFQYSREEMLQLGVAELSHGQPPYSMAEARPLMKAALAGEIRSLEWLCRRKDRRRLWMWVSLRPLSINDRDCLVCTIRDTTAQKASEKALLESERHLESLLTSSRDGICILNPDLSIRQINHVMRSWYVTGFKPEGMPCHSAFHSADAPCDPCPARKSLESGRMERVVVPGPEGTDIQWLEIYCYPVKDELGRVSSLIEFARDITASKQAEDELRETRALIQACFEQSPAGIIVADAPDTRIRMVNPAALGMHPEADETIVGTRLEEWVGIWNLFRPDGSPYLLREMPLVRAVEEGVESRNVEVVLRSDHGEESRILCNAGPIRSPEGAVQAGILVFLDITEQRQAETARDRSERKLYQATEAVRDGVWYWDVRSDAFSYSPRWFTMLGYEPDAFPHAYETWRNLLHPDDLERAEQAVRERLFVGRSYSVEFRMRTADGGWKWILSRGKAVETDSDGKAVRILGTHVDITGRRTMEDELLRLRNYLGNIIDSMPSILVGVDEQERVTLWNEKAEQLTGLLSEEVRGRLLVEVFPRMERDMDMVRAAMEKGDPMTLSKIPSYEEGHTRYEDLMVYPLTEGTTRGAVIRLDDVTGQVRMEEMMIQSEKMLSVGGLAAGMAHEINNPLAVVIGTARNIQNRLFKPLKKNETAARECGLDLEVLRKYIRLRDIDSMLEAIHDAGLRGSHIVNNMLSFSRKSEKRFVECRLDELLDATVDLAANDYDLKKDYDFRRIEIVREYDPEVPPVVCEKGEIQQVLLNLLKNGAEAMADKEYGEEGPRFLLRVSRDRDMAVVMVEDNGPGMEEEVRKRIFEPFYTTKSSGKGTGLGLSISFLIVVEQHRGRLEVLSSPGHGACFVVGIPLVPAEEIVETES